MEKGNMEKEKEKIVLLTGKGNTALENGDYKAAIENYSEAIAYDGHDYVLLSKRSAAYGKAGLYQDALADAEKMITLIPDWGKGYSRKGSALAFLGQFDESIKTLKLGISRDPDNQQLKDGLEEVEQQWSKANHKKVANPFQMPSAIDKLQANPHTQELMKDPEFSKLVNDLTNSPTTLGHQLTDSRVLTAVGVLLGLDVKSDKESDVSTPPFKKPAMSPDSPISGPPTSAATEESIDEEFTTAQLTAVREKHLGNDAYKRKEFDSALMHYYKAVALDGRNITYRNNIAAVYFEERKYQQCIDQCVKAVEVGRENRADYQLIAKAFIRNGNAHKKMGDLYAAKTCYEKAMSEHRTPEVKALLTEVEKQIAEEEELSYIDPIKAEESKDMGNRLFNKGNYSEALKHYTEAIKRNPQNPKYYSNRAACYTKLAAFDLGLRDCDTCLEIEPQFIKGWLRKGKILLGMQQASKALTAYQRAVEIDPNNAEALEGFKKSTMTINANPEEVRKRAMADPEVQAIMRDPAMRLILEQMQNDPLAQQDHLKNPGIAAKIQKLLECGLIAFR